MELAACPGRAGKEGIRWEWVFYALVAAQLICILLISIKGPKFVWDEAWYLNDVTLVSQYGFSREFFMNLSGPPGPLFAWSHAIFYPVTHASLPQVRVINYCFLLVLLLGISWAIKALKNTEFTSIGLSIVALPPIVVISGIVLTDLPALTCFSLGIAFFLYAYRAGENAYKAWMWSICSGVLFSLAILGRQTYLVPCGVFLLLAFIFYARIRSQILLIGVISMVPFGMLAYVWGGIVPPTIKHVSEGLRVQNLVLSFFYFGIIVLIMCPKWLKMKLWEIAVFLVVGVVLNYYFNMISILPMNTLFQQFVTSPKVLGMFKQLFSAGIVGMAGITFAAICKRGWENRGDRLYVCFVVSMLSIMISTIKISHQFHSKYIIGTIPFFVLMALPELKLNRMFIVRMVIGSVLGLVLLYTYLF